MTAQTKYFVLLGISAAFLLTIIVYLATSSGGVDFNHHVIGRDFVNMHFGGNLISDGKEQALFSQTKYYEELRSVYGDRYALHNWSYPPLLWPIAQFFGSLPYFLAYLLYTAVGIGLVLLAVIKLGLPKIWAVLICLSPAGTWNILAGQNGFIFSSLFVIAIIFTYHSRHVQAGLTWAFLAIKPHLGICVLPYLFLGKQFRIIFWGALFLGGAILLTIAMYGVAPWEKFLSYTTKQQVWVLENWDGLVLTAVGSMFMQGRLLGLDISTAYLMHFGFAAVAACLLFLRWPGKQGSLTDWISWLVVGTLILLPYSFTYDWVMFHFVLALWFEREGGFEKGNGSTGKRLCFFGLWLMPFFGVLIAGGTNIQIMPLGLLLFLVFWPSTDKSSREEEESGEQPVQREPVATL